MILNIFHSPSRSLTQQQKVLTQQQKMQAHHDVEAVAGPHHRRAGAGKGEIEVVRVSMRHGLGISVLQAPLISEGGWQYGRVLREKIKEPGKERSLCRTIKLQLGKMQYVVFEMERGGKNSWPRRPRWRSTCGKRAVVLQLKLHRPRERRIQAEALDLFTFLTLSDAASVG